MDSLSIFFAFFLVNFLIFLNLFDFFFFAFFDWFLSNTTAPNRLAQAAEKEFSSKEAAQHNDNYGGNNRRDRQLSSTTMHGRTATT